MYIIFSAIIVVLLMALTDPFMVLMPSAAQMFTLLIVSAFLVVWAGLLMHEKAKDERENAHRMLADRNAYLVGMCILAVALVMQGLSHAIDSWIPLALAGMIVVKAVSHWYADTYR
jgi:hypothetical protein